MKKPLIGILIGILLLVSACTAGNREASVVSVAGESTIKVDPDRAVFYASIQTLENTAEEAQGKNKDVSEKVIKELLFAGLEKGDIETSYYNLYKREDWTEDGPEFKGYQADHTLKITAKKVEDVGKYIDIAVRNGATSIQSVNFELSDAKRKQVSNQALEAAGSEAKEKAEILAKSVGGKVGRIVKITESTTDYYPIPIYRDLAVAESEKAAEVPVQPQKLDVSARVTVEYEIR